MDQATLSKIEREYQQLPRDIQLALNDHANELVHFAPLLMGLRTPKQEVEHSRGYDFVRLYSIPKYSKEDPHVQRYVGKLNSLFEEANEMVAHEEIDLERMKEIREEVDILMYGRERKS